MTDNEILEKVKLRWQELKALNLSEIDTQVLLVEPILTIAGWDLLNYSQVKRASRSSKGQEFDIGLYSPTSSPYVFFAIECKALQNAWFNIDRFTIKRKEIGQLKNIGKKSAYWVHNWGACDGVGQLRAYCANYDNSFSRELSTAILTNGYDWVIFDTKTFVPEPGSLTAPITMSAIKARANLEDIRFAEDIIDKLKP